MVSIKFIVVRDYKERLQASEQEKQCLLQILELKQKMERAKDAQISTTLELQAKCKYHNVVLSKQTSPFDLPHKH